MTIPALREELGARVDETVCESGGSVNAPVRRLRVSTTTGMSYASATGRRAMRIMPFLSAVGLAALMILAGSPSLGQAPKSGGWLNLRLREDLPQGFAIHESPTFSTMCPAEQCLHKHDLLDPIKPTHLRYN